MASCLSDALGQDQHGQQHQTPQHGDVAQHHNARPSHNQFMMAPTHSTPGKRFVPPGQMPTSPRDGAVVESNWDAGQVSLGDLISLAEANNPTLRQATLHIDATLGKAIQAGLYPNPVFRYSAEQIGVGGTAGEFHGGILSQEIVRGKKLHLSQEKYLQRVKVAEANAVAQQFRVCNDVRMHFFSVLAWQHRVAVQQELVKSAEDTAVTTREAHNMGQANAVEIRRTNVAFQKARLQLLQSENKLREAKRAVSALVGVDVSVSDFLGQLEREPMAIEFEAVLTELWTNSPQLMAARAKAQSDRITIQREMAEPISNITLEGGVGYNFDANETVGVAGVSFPLNIYDRNQGTIRQARSDLARQCAEIERIQQALRRELAMQYESYLTSTQHVQQYQQVILPELKETYRLMLESYKANRLDWFEVLHAQSDYYTSQIEYFGWLEQLRRSEVLIDGMLLHGGLQAAEGTTPPGHIDAVAKPR